MGKKKDKRERQARDAREQNAGHASAKHKNDAMAPLAGIAAVIAKQMGTPAGRQVIAAGLMAAAGAIAGKDARPAGARPTPPPVPPVPPAQPASPFAGETPEPPRSAAPALPPEVAKVIGSVAAGLERWAAGFGAPKKNDPPAA